MCARSSSCQACEAITQPPAPSHPIARGRAGPKLLAHVLVAKYGLHLQWKGEKHKWRRPRGEISDAEHWDGPNRISDEGSY